MSAITTFRLIEQNRYFDLLPVFDELSRGHTTVPLTFTELLQEALKEVQKNDFLEYNKEFDIGESWYSLLSNTLHLCKTYQLDKLPREEKKELIEILIALLCMPQFQSYYTSFSSPISENCFILGQWDEGLLLFLRQNSRWFDSLSSWDFPFNYAKYPYGESMAIFTADQLEECSEAMIFTASLCSDNKELSTHHKHLYQLVNRVRGIPSQTLALTTE